MNVGKQLSDLQQIDHDLEAKAEELKQVESQLCDDKVLTQAQEELQKQQDYLAGLEKQQKAAESKVDDLQAKLNPLQEKLFAGAETNPKELMNLQHQVEGLKNQVNSEEDGILELMSQIEMQQKEMSSKTAEVEKLKQEWQKSREELLKYKGIGSKTAQYILEELN